MRGCIRSIWVQWDEKSGGGGRAPAALALPMATAAPNSTVAEPCVIVIFGASGDLTHRKLIPSLYDLFRQKALPERTKILGVSRTPMSDTEFRSNLRSSAEKFSAHFDADAWDRFCPCVHYQPGDAAEMTQGDAITTRINALAREAGIMKAAGGG